MRQPPPNVDVTMMMATWSRHAEKMMVCATTEEQEQEGEKEEWQCRVCVMENQQELGLELGKVGLIITPCFIQINIIKQLLLWRFHLPQEKVG